MPKYKAGDYIWYPNTKQIIEILKVNDDHYDIRVIGAPSNKERPFKSSFNIENRSSLLNSKIFKVLYG